MLILYSPSGFFSSPYYFQWSQMNSDLKIGLYDSSINTFVKINIIVTVCVFVCHMFSYHPSADVYFILETGSFQSALLFTSTISDPMTVT
jgi:hypothetical protein